MTKRSKEPMLELFIFETAQLLEQLEQVTLSSEKTNFYSEHDMNEIFRVMHTIKSSAAMMLFDNISSLAHSMEDIFYYIRERRPKHIEFPLLTDLVLKGGDFIKKELAKIEQSDTSAEADPKEIIEQNQQFLEKLKKDNASSDGISYDEKKAEPVKRKPKYYISSDRQEEAPSGQIFKAVIHFTKDCGMENVRAFLAVQNIKEIASEIFYFPEDIAEDNNTDEMIRKNGFTILFKTKETEQKVNEKFQQTAFLEALELTRLKDENEMYRIIESLNEASGKTGHPQSSLRKSGTEDDTCLRVLSRSMISVNLEKLDNLMDLVGELVVSEKMVTQNPDLQGLTLENFDKSARHLRKITGELQDLVMSMRMVPLSATFQRMHRILRDMCKKLDKDIELKILGEQTEVDKNIIEHISDPLIHIIRNAIDHGIERPEERVALGKDKTGKIILEAKNAGGNVLIIIKDDGRGLNREKLIERARANGLIRDEEKDLTDREVFSFIFVPGFSTSDDVTEFSGRGVGMDVVTENLDKIRGVATVDSVAGEGTTITIRIPLTLAIIGGLNVKVGSSTYTIPITSIRESLKPKEEDIIKDPDGNEMIMVRGQCYPILRLHEFYHTETEIKDIHEGIIVIVEDDLNTLCIFADELLGEQEVVVKALPMHVNKVKGLAGCTLLGDGSISLILDVATLAGDKQ